MFNRPALSPLTSYLLSLWERRSLDPLSLWERARVRATDTTDSGTRRPSLAGRVWACKPRPLRGLAACGSKAPLRPQPSPRGRGSNTSLVTMCLLALASTSTVWSAELAPAAVAIAPATAASAPVAALAAPAPAAAASAPPASLDTRIQDVKGDVIRLNRDLLVLEEELLFPANTQVALFVSMDVGKMFSLDSVQIKLDDKPVTNYLYTPAEVSALHRGGVQRVFVGNLKSGEHTIVAFFTGGGPHERDYKRGTTIKFDKGVEPKYIELQIKDSMAKLQPEFDVKVWQ